MYHFYTVTILLTVIIGLKRVLEGPTRADRMLSAQICGTAIVAILLLLAHNEDRLYLYDVALVFALLAAVATIAFVRLIWLKSGEQREDGDEPA